MALAKHYRPAEAEERIARWWAEQGIYEFAPAAERPGLCHRHAAADRLGSPAPGARVFV
jgi:hypothetical protein